VRRFTFVLLVCLAGLGASEWVYRSVVGRDLIGRIFGRGHLVALAHGNGVYEIDLRREKMADDSPAEIKNATHRLAIEAALRSLSGKEHVAAHKVAKECDLVRWQFENEKAFFARMRATGFSKQSLTTAAADNLKARQWIEEWLASRITVTEEECRGFYHTHRDAFALPRRLRASHIFLAAPAETPSEDVESKRLLIESLSQRIEQGEDFSDLVTEASEDEATKWRGGDLGFFASSRMLPEFFAAATNLPVGGLSKPIRSPLGFHIIQVTTIEPVRLISFEEARAEILNALQNEQRSRLAGGLTARLTKEVEYFGVAR